MFVPLGPLLVLVCSLSVPAGPLLIGGGVWIANITCPSLNQTSELNPFDPRDVSVTATVTSGTFTANYTGALVREFSRAVSGSGDEVLTPEGPAYFRVPVLLPARCRMACSGRARVALSVWTRTMGVKVFPDTVVAVQPAEEMDGPVEPGADGTSFRTLDGRRFFPLGENVAWPTAGGTFDYDRWLGRLAAAGASYFRLWLGGLFTSLTLESARTGGPLRYSLEAGWRIRYILSLADRLGLRPLVTLLSFNDLRKSDPDPEWPLSAYNSANPGGFLDTPQEFWSSERAQELMRARFLYISSLLGGYHKLFAVELFNEVDLVEDFASLSPQVAQWHNVTLGLVSGWLEPQTVMLSTSFSSSAGFPLIDSLPGMTFTSTHSYGASDMAANAAFWCTKKQESYRKPSFLGEFGLAAPDTVEHEDPEGLEVHNGNMAALASGCAGGAMMWWWDTAFDRLDFYALLTPIRALIEAFPAASQASAPLAVKPQIGYNLYWSSGLLWIQNANSTWSRQYYIRSAIEPWEDGRPITVVASPTWGDRINVTVFSVSVANFGVIERAEVAVEHGIAQVPLPTFYGDVAIVFEREQEK
jgi:hypothetical protein